jgi:hypothetical protein
MNGFRTFGRMLVVFIKARPITIDNARRNMHNTKDLHADIVLLRQREK